MLLKKWMPFFAIVIFFVLFLKLPENQTHIFSFYPNIYAQDEIDKTEFF